MSGRFSSEIDEAVKIGDLHTVEQYLRKYPTRVNDALYQDSRRPLHIAAQNDQLAMVQLLLSYGAEIGATDQGGHTALHLAAKAGASKVLNHLLDCKANTEAITKVQKWTALHFAAEQGKSDVVEDLVKAGANTKAETRDTITPLHLACQKGHTEVVAALILSGADANAKDRVGFTPLHMAVESRTPPLVQLLIWYLADVNASSKFGWTPLHMAAQLGDAACIRLLLDAGANPSATTSEGKSAHDIAALNNQTAVLPLLVPMALPPIDKRGSSARELEDSALHDEVPSSSSIIQTPLQPFSQAVPAQEPASGEWQPPQPAPSPPSPVASPFAQVSSKPIFANLSISEDPYPYPDQGMEQQQQQQQPCAPCSFCAEGPLHPPALFICPLTKRVMEDPVVAVDGYSYERKEIQDWFRKGNALSPVTQQVLKHTAVISNHPLKDAINDWLNWSAQQRGAPPVPRAPSVRTSASNIVYTV